MTGTPERGDPVSRGHAELAPPRPQRPRVVRALVGVGYVTIYAAAAMISSPILSGADSGEETVAITLTFLAIVLAAALALATLARPIQ